MSNFGVKKYILRFGAIFTLVALLLTGTVLVGADEPVAQSGSCGSALSWSFHAGTLTITGEGDMTNFTEPDMAPWYPLRDQITRVVFPEGLTSIGNIAFYDCVNLRTVILPDSIRRIGNYAFSSCEGLEVLRLGPAVRDIGNAAFYGCLKLGAVTFPYGLETLGYQVFYRCESLATVTIPPYLNSMGTSAFAYCKSLIKAEIQAPLKTLPEWTFYGCERLTVVVLPETVGSVETYAFKRCDSLINIFSDGSVEQLDEIRKGVEEDVPEFAYGGFVGSGVASDSNLSGSITENEDGTITQENVTVTEGDNMTLVSTVVQNRPSNGSSGDDLPGTTPGTTPGNGGAGGSYSVDISITVENKDGWASATDAVQDALKDINDVYAGGNKTSSGTNVTVYMKEDGSIDEAFLSALAGRDLTVTVVSPDGSSWKVDCSTLKRDELSGAYNYSYTVIAADASICEKLGTDRCYRITFAQSATINAEVLIQLPTGSYHTNAFLYQVESDGSYTRLQAVVVDTASRAHFYLASVNSETTYIIGLNVPEESTDDVIIPDELLPQYGNIVDRVEKIEYVVTGVESSWGLSFWQVTGILIGVLVVVIGGVGGVMFVVNRRRVKAMAGAGNKRG